MNRGRIQSQGGGIEESESWRQEKPLQAFYAHVKTNSLELRHSKVEKELRKVSFNKARNFIDAAKNSGGVTHPVSKSYPVKGDKNRRVDIEVHEGVAFT